MKGNVKCKNSRFEPPFAGLRGNVHTAGFIHGSMESALSTSSTLTAEALLSEICRNRSFLKGWVTLSANF